MNHKLHFCTCIKAGWLADSFAFPWEVTHQFPRKRKKSLQNLLQSKHSQEILENLRFFFFKIQVMYISELYLLPVIIYIFIFYSQKNLLSRFCSIIYCLPKQYGRFYIATSIHMKTDKTSWTYSRLCIYMYATTASTSLVAAEPTRNCDIIVHFTSRFIYMQ